MGVRRVSPEQVGIAVQSTLTITDVTASILGRRAVYQISSHSISVTLIGHFPVGMRNDKFYPSHAKPINQSAKFLSPWICVVKFGALQI